MSEKLPTIIVGALPPPEALQREHRVTNQHYTPDGQSLTCQCGFSTRFHHSESALDEEWTEHLD